MPVVVVGGAIMTVSVAGAELTETVIKFFRFSCDAVRLLMNTCEKLSRPELSPSACVRHIIIGTYIYMFGDYYYMD